MKLSPSAKQLLRTVLLLLFLPLVSWAQFPDGADSRQSIFGRILFAGDNHPAERVKVELRLFPGVLVATTFTGQGGEFAFAGLPSGTYLVVVEEPGCEPIQESVSLDFSSGLLLLQLNRTDSARPTGLGYVVSARELIIPSKARKAFQNGLQRLARNDLASSVAHFQRAIGAFPGYYEAYYQMGVADLKLGHEGDAELALQKSVELSGGRYAQPQLVLGAILCYQKKYAEAEPTIRRGLQLDSTGWTGHYSLAQTLFGLNRLDEAEKSAREVVSRKADFANIYLLLAAIHIRQSNYSALLNDLDDYLKLDPDSATSVRAKAIREDARRALSQANGAATLGQKKP